MAELEVRRFGPDDTDDVRTALAVRHATEQVDSPWQRPTLLPAYVAELRHGWDGEPETPYLALVDGEVVGTGSVSLTERDNRHLAWLSVRVVPGCRRRGHGRRLFELLVEEARATGRTSVAVYGWESEATLAFARAVGVERRSQEIQRRQHLAELSPGRVQRLYDEAAAAAGGYELVRMAGRTPPGSREAMAELMSAINDAPSDDLDIEDEVFTADRLEAYESATLARGMRLYRLVARHRGSGALAGHTVVAVEAAQPSVAEQHDTAVARAHRGHRLGLLLKAGMLLWLAQAEPRLETVDTWNAESNEHMVAVNEALGYRVMGRELHFQTSW